MKNSCNSSVRCAIILAGGEGQRLRPFIRRLRGDALPKQYVNFIGKRSMLEQTFDRAEKLIPPERLFTVVSQDHLGMIDVWRQLSGRPRGTVVMQPENKETGPGLLLALVHVYKRYPDSIVAIFPSDHFIAEEDLFMGYVELAFRAVERDPSRLVLLGVEPDGPELEYGYILPGKAVDDQTSGIVRHVMGFIEKPGLVAAELMIEKGALWNSMVMAFSTKTLMSLLQRVDPTLHRSFQRICDAIGTEAERDVVEETYRSMEPVNFSKGFLETLALQSASYLGVLTVRGVFWSDWGSEARILGDLQKFGSLGVGSTKNAKSSPHLDSTPLISTDLVYKHNDVSRTPLHMAGGNGMKRFAGITTIVLIIYLALSIQAPASPPSSPSDFWIKTALESVMERNGHFDLDRIQVSTRDGVVKLSGNVLTGDEIGLVELLAMQIPGVKAIKNNIRVIPAVDQNVALEKETRSALFENPLVHIRELKVQAKNGIVTLKGIVYHAEQKRLAIALVSMLPGINTVINSIDVLHHG